MLLHFLVSLDCELSEEPWPNPLFLGKLADGMSATRGMGVAGTPLSLTVRLAQRWHYTGERKKTYLSAQWYRNTLQKKKKEL